MLNLTWFVYTVCACAGMCECKSVCVCVCQDSTEGEDILLLPQENSTTVQECLICNAILLQTHTHTLSVYMIVVVQWCMQV